MSDARAVFAPWAVLPAKRFGRAKTRLGAALAATERRELAGKLCERVLAACQQSLTLHGVLVATDGDDVAALAARRGAHVLRDVETAPASLARVVDAALAALRARGASHALVIMGDLPHVQARDVRELLAAMQRSDVVLCPDAQRRGTSALGVRLDQPFTTAFGQKDSLARHLHEAARCGARTHVLCNPRLALDVDTPQDLATSLQPNATPFSLFPSSRVPAALTLPRPARAAASPRRARSAPAR